MKTKMNEVLRSNCVGETVEMCGNLFIGQKIAYLDGKPTLISSALALEKIFKKDVAFVVTEDSLYCEIKESNGEIFKAFLHRNEMAYDKDPVDEISLIIPYILWNLSDNTENPMLKNTVKDLCEEFLANGTRTTVSKLIEFCNETKKIKDDVIDVSSGLVVETVQQYLKHRNTKIGKIRPLQAMEFPKISLDITKPKKTADKGKVISEFDFEKAKEGEYRIKWDWSEDATNNIPSLDILDDFIPNETFYKLLRKISYRLGIVIKRIKDGESGEKAIGNDYINVMVYGKPSSGKSVTLRAVASVLGLPFWVVNTSRNSEEDVFEGMNKIVAGKIAFQKTAFLNGFEEGGIIVIEEIDLIFPDTIMGAIGQGIEKPFIINKDGYIPTKRHPLCVIFGTKNVGVHGCKDMSEALRRRFKTSYEMEDPKREDFIDILEKRFGDRPLCEWVYDIYTEILDYLENPENNAEDIALGVTLSACIGCLENIEEGSSRKEAVRDSIIGKIGEVDVKLAQTLYHDLVKNYREG